MDHFRKYSVQPSVSVIGSGSETSDTAFSNLMNRVENHIDKKGMVHSDQVEKLLICAKEHGLTVLLLF